MHKTALLSVSDKTNLVPFAKALADQNVKLIASGGTAARLIEAGLQVSSVSSLTGFPEILGGRVKTLHPVIHGGILAMRTEEHLNELQGHGIGTIDLVVCNLYPFSQTVANPGVTFSDAIEQYSHSEVWIRGGSLCSTSSSDADPCACGLGSSPKKRVR